MRITIQEGLPLLIATESNETRGRREACVIREIKKENIKSVTLDHTCEKILTKVSYDKSHELRNQNTVHIF